MNENRPETMTGHNFIVTEAERSLGPEKYMKLVKTRMELDFQYACKQRVEGKKRWKKDWVRQRLLEYFTKSPFWDYETRIRIAADCDLTFNQVSKWNWDHRRRLGMKTNSRRLKKHKLEELDLQAEPEI